MRFLRSGALLSFALLFSLPARVSFAGAPPGSPPPPAHSAPLAPPSSKSTHREANRAAKRHRLVTGRPATKAAPEPRRADGASAEADAIPLPPPKPPPIVDPNIGTVTGLALPRFASLRADEVNMRAGPGTRYPIEWLYKRRGLPVEIEREFEVWRLVKDADGVRGWVHEATLTGHRDFVVIGGDRPLRREPDLAARAIAVLKPGVTGRIRSCASGADWCHVQVGTYTGWLQRDELWGTLPGEAIRP